MTANLYYYGFRHCKVLLLLGSSSGNYNYHHDYDDDDYYYYRYKLALDWDLEGSACFIESCTGRRAGTHSEK